MRGISPHRLWIGHAGDLRNPRVILDTGISAVIDLAIDEPIAALPRELVYCRCPILDGEGNPEWLLSLAIQTTASLLRDQVPTLVCCSGGMSRSVLISAAALSLQSGKSLTASMTEVQGGAVDISPALMADVLRITSSCQRA